MKKNLLIPFLIVINMSLLFSNTKYPINRNNKIADYRWMQVNQMNMPLTNYGIFGQTIDGKEGFYWPSGFPNETYIFGASIWVGGLVRRVNNPTKFDTQLTCGYNPNSGGTEFTQGEPGHASDPDQKIYFSSDSDWPLKDSQGQDSVVSTTDAYFIYNDYDETKHFVPENKPLDITVIHQIYAWTGKLKEDMLFFVYNIVLDPEKDTLHNAFMGICADNAIGNEYGTNANDLVSFDRTRNLAFQFQTVLEPGWAHSPGTIAYKFLQGPTSNGVDTVHYYKDPYDTTKTDSIVIHPDDTLGMTAFKIFTIDVDPADKFERYQVMSGYNYRTLDPNNVEASYHPFDIDEFGPGDKRIILTAGPFNLIPGDTAKVIYAILMAKDTSELPVKADVAQAIFDGGWLAPGPPDPPHLYVVPDDKKVTLYWDNNAETSPDKYAKIALVDSIWQHTSATDSVLKPNPSFNPKYRAYDLAGYKVWRSRYPVGDSFKMIAHFDKKDGLEILNQDSLYDVMGDSFVITKAETLGNDNGLAYSYVDEDSLYDGIPYYYAVTAYDANYENYTVDTITGDTIGTLPTSYESAITGNMTSVIPQGHASNYVAPSASVEFARGNQQLFDNNIVHMTVMPVVNDRLDDTPDKYEIRFGSIETDGSGNPVYSFILYDKVDSVYMPADTSGNPIWQEIATEPQTIVDSTYNDSTGSYDYDTSLFWVSKDVKSLPLSGAIVRMDSFKINPSNNRVDSIIINDAVAYTDTLLLTDSTPYGATYTHIQSHPYYNGGSYKITWHVVGDSALTCDVYDMVNGIDVPYSPNWDFGWRFGKKDSTSGGGQGKYMFFSDSTADNWKAMYIDGVSIFFNYHANATPPIPNKRILPMSQSNKPAEGDTWYIYNTAYPTPSSGNAFSLSFTKGTFTATVEDTLLAKVSVAPNPYLVRNSMEPNVNEPKLMFMNLPDSCDIYIYTLTGDLVDMIEHRDVSGNGMEYWNVLTNPNLTPASGIYLYVVETLDQKHRATGKFAIIK